MIAVVRSLTWCSRGRGSAVPDDKAVRDHLRKINASATVHQLRDEASETAALVREVQRELPYCRSTPPSAKRC